MATLGEQASASSENQLDRESPDWKVYNCISGLRIAAGTGRLKLVREWQEPGDEPHGSRQCYTYAVLSPDGGKPGHQRVILKLPNMQHKHPELVIGTAETNVAPKLGAFAVLGVAPYEQSAVTFVIPELTIRASDKVGEEYVTQAVRTTWTEDGMPEHKIDRVGSITNMDLDDLAIKMRAPQQVSSAA